MAVHWPDVPVRGYFLDIVLWESISLRPSVTGV